MFLDYPARKTATILFSVFDAETGECLDRSRPYFRADDEAGYLDRFDVNENGANFVVPGSDPPEVPWSRHPARIRIWPREGLSPELTLHAMAILEASPADRDSLEARVVRRSGRTHEECPIEILPG